jgi:hypothetical protein
MLPPWRIPQMFYPQSPVFGTISELLPIGGEKQPTQSNDEPRSGANTMTNVECRMSNEGILSVLKCYPDGAKRLPQLVNIQLPIVIYLGCGLRVIVHRA